MDIKQRITDLAEAIGIDTSTDDRVSEDRCWVDGRVRCPYGKPAGQYLLRPTQFCCQQFGGESCCEVYIHHIGDPDLPEALANEGVRDYFEEQHTDVASELRARADVCGESTPEHLVLDLAADILEDRKLNRDILLKDDLPSPPKQ